VGIQTECFSNGFHEVKIVVMHEGNIICSQPVRVTFSNQLTNVVASDGFRPSKDYILYGIGPGNYSVEVYDEYNESIVYSNTFQDSINAQIPSSTFVPIPGSQGYAYYPYELRVKRVVRSQAMTDDNIATASNGEDIVKRILARIFDRSDYPPNCPVKILISCGDTDVERAKMQCITAVMTAAVRKGMNPIYIGPGDCSFENVEYCLNLNYVKKWYHASHGNHKLPGRPPRQCINFNDGKVFSYLRKDFNPVPPDYEPLWWFDENNHSIRELGFYNNRKLNWVQFNCCYSGYTTEFPYALGILPIDDPLGIGTRIFIGWKGPALMYDILGNYNQYEQRLWKKLSEGENLWDAFDYATMVPGGLQIMQNFIYYGVIDMHYVFFRHPDIN
jgi:hypothetical protein